MQSKIKVGDAVKVKGGCTDCYGAIAYVVAIRGMDAELNPVGGFCSYIDPGDQPRWPLSELEFICHADD